MQRIQMSRAHLILALLAGSTAPALAVPAGSAGVADSGTPKSRSHDTFTVVGIPDTQNYSEFYPEIYNAQTRWIADNRTRHNIQFASHYGDVVNHGDRANEWANSRVAMATLDRANIPYGVTPGNHDITPSGSAGTPYIPQQYLANYGPQHYQGRDWYLGASPSGMSSAQIFRGGGREFLALHIACDMPVEELAWAQGLMNRHRDKAVMMTTHRYLQDAEDYTGGVPLVPSGRYPSIWYGVEGTYHPQGIQSDEAFDWFIRRNKQIFMVNCGHFHEEYRQTSTNIYGSPVHEVLADYQDDPNGGDGWMRLMEFDVSNNRINFETYSPTRDEYRSADESRFNLGVNFDDYRWTTPSLSFQNGINGYQGTQDTWINEGSSNTSYGNNGTFDVDDDTGNSIFNDRRGQGLLRFDNIFSGSGEEGKIPLGATITSATLRLQFQDDVDFLFDADFNVHMMTRDWNENSTWNSLGGGLQQGSDYGLFLGQMDGDNNPDADYLRILDVTAAVQMWADGLANFGFAILPEIISGNDDGITIFSSENGNILFRPVLDVTYTFNGLLRTVPAPGAAVLLVLAGVSSNRRRRV